MATSITQATVRAIDNNLLKNAPTVASTKTVANYQNKYAVYSYPIDLGSDRYPHYMMFFINVNAKSKYEQKQGGVVADADLTSNRFTQNGNSITSALQTGSIADAAKNSLTKLANGITSAGKAANVDTSTIANTVKDFKLGATFNRTKMAIALPIPENLGTSYGISYGDISAGIWGQAVLGGLEDLTSVDTVKEGMKKLAVGNAPASLVQPSIGGLLSGLGLVNGSSAGIMAAATGTVNNTRAEMMFDHANFRTHQFRFDFMPRSQAESDNIREIIQLFKENMHPEIQQNDNDVNGKAKLNPAFLITPSEFNIQFFYKDKENDAVHKIATCVLENMSVNYTPNNTWAAFSGTYNPVGVVLELSFKETTLLVRQQIEQGL